MTPAKNRTALRLAAVRAVVNDPEALAALSPPSRILLATVRSGLEESLGKNLANLTDEMASGVSEATGSAVASTVADVADAVPVVGTVLGWIVKFFGSLFGGASAAAAEYCNRYLSAFKPQGTGSMLGGGTTVPADIFASINPIPVDDYWGHADPGNTFVLGAQLYPSSLGSALMALTEGIPADPHQIPALIVKPIVDKAIQTVIAGTDKEYRDNRTPWGKHHSYGVAKKWRKIFRALREAMAAEHGPELPDGAVSDGGLWAWPIYLDLLSKLAEPAHPGDIVGTLPLDYIHWTIGSRGAAYLSEDISLVNPHGNGRPFRYGMFGGEAKYHPGGDPERACVSILTDQIQQLLDGWRHTVKPYYQGGKAQIAGLEAEAKVIATDSILRARANGKLAPKQAGLDYEWAYGNAFLGATLLAGLGVAAGVGMLALRRAAAAAEGPTGATSLHPHEDGTFTFIHDGKTYERIPRALVVQHFPEVADLEPPTR